MKIDKEFTLSDSTLNTYGFRLLTTGYVLAEFAKNPIGYFMHERDNGILVKWDDLQIKGDKIVGKPNINISNIRGQKTIDEINTGFLNAASVGHIVVLESSDDPSLKYPGQIGPTVTKWYNRECSLVDIPANTSAMCLYDSNDNIINLKQWSGGMKNLSSTAHANPDNIDIKPLLAASLMDRDITEEIAQQLYQQYKDDPKKVIPVLRSMAKMRIDYLIGMPWDEMDKSNQGEELAKKYLTGYKLKRYLEFGKKSNGVYDNDAFLKFAVDNGYIQPSFAEDGFTFDERGNNTKEVIFNKICGFINASTQGLIDADWDSLTPDQQNRLKQEAFSAYKNKYEEKLGIAYKEPTA